MKKVMKSDIEEFLNCKKIAVAGVSRSGKKFGNSVFKELKSMGYEVYPVNPNTDEIEGVKSYPGLLTLKGMIDGAVLVVPPRQTEQLVRDAVNAGVKHVWMQQGSESEDAINYCKENNIKPVYGECILMYAEPTAFFHKMHRGINKLIGKAPG